MLRKLVLAILVGTSFLLVTQNAHAQYFSGYGSGYRTTYGTIGPNYGNGYRTPYGTVNPNSGNGYWTPYGTINPNGYSGFSYPYYSRYNRALFLPRYYESPYRSYTSRYRYR